MFEAETFSCIEVLKHQLEAQGACCAFLIAQQKIREESWEVKERDLGELRGVDEDALK